MTTQAQPTTTESPLITAIPNLPAQKRISRGLNKALARAREEAVITLAPGHRYVIFSDHHRGAGDEADDFARCRATYLGALDEYYRLGFSLIILGDSEELLENKIQEVMQTYADVFESEGRFFPDRYFRIVGNHDNAWGIKSTLHKYLERYLPNIQVYYSLLLQYRAEPGGSGDIFLAHGHQGTLDSDVFGFLPPVLLPLYRIIQNLTGLGHTSPSRDACLRGLHDTLMYRWSSGQSKMLFIAGHTHRPVWSSRTHLEKLLYEYASLIGLEADKHPADYAEQLAELQAAIKKRETEYPPCNDTIKTRPSYFNTGCCRYKDGDITGIELEEGELRLVKWAKKDGEIKRSVLEKAPLSELFALL